MWVGESGREAPTFTHPAQSTGLCHFDWKNEAKQVLKGEILNSITLKTDTNYYLSVCDENINHGILKLLGVST